MLLQIMRFILLGAVCFAAAQVLRVGVGQTEPAEPILISQSQIEQLRSEWTETWSADPSDFEMRVMIARAIDDEILHREALRIGLHHADPVVRQRLVQNMRFLSQADDTAPDDDAALYREALELGMADRDIVVRRRLIQQMTSLFSASAKPPATEEVRAFVQAHPERFSSSNKLRLSYVFVAEHDMAKITSSELLAALSRDDEALSRSRTIRTGVFSEKMLGQRFGAPLASGVADLLPGEWSGPFAHVGGAHWVRLDEVIPGAPSPFEYVRDRARQELLQERQHAAVAEALRRLHLEYEISVAGSASEEGRSS